MFGELPLVIYIYIYIYRYMSVIFCYTYKCCFCLVFVGRKLILDKQVVLGAAPVQDSINPISKILNIHIGIHIYLYVCVYV